MRNSKRESCEQARERRSERSAFSTFFAGREPRGVSGAVGPRARRAECRSRTVNSVTNGRVFEAGRRGGSYGGAGISGLGFKKGERSTDESGHSASATPHRFCFSCGRFECGRSDFARSDFGRFDYGQRAAPNWS